VIACDQVNRSAPVLESNHLSAEKQAGAVVFPVAIVEVTCDDDEVYGLLNGEVHQIFKGPSCRPSQHLNWGPFVCFESLKRAVEMRVGRVDKAYHVVRKSIRAVEGGAGERVA